jgi:putative transposase
VSRFIHKSHNVSVLLYHFVCPTKYRRSVITKRVDVELLKICEEISLRYEIDFLEIGTDRNHVHFLVQSVPTLSPTRVITIIKSLITRELKNRLPELRKELWGGSFWSSGFFVNSVGSHGSESVIRKYVEMQGLKEYEPLAIQLGLFTEPTA